MDRLDLELYADRLARHAERLADDISAARLRLVWRDLERRARSALGAEDALRLETIGVLGAAAADDDERLIARRQAQMAAVGRLQAFVEAELATLASRSPS